MPLSETPRAIYREVGKRIDCLRMLCSLPPEAIDDIYEELSNTMELYVRRASLALTAPDEPASKTGVARRGGVYEREAFQISDR